MGMVNQNPIFSEGLADEARYLHDAEENAAYLGRDSGLVILCALVQFSGEAWNFDKYQDNTTRRWENKKRGRCLQRI